MPASEPAATTTPRHQSRRATNVERQQAAQQAAAERKEERSVIVEVMNKILFSALQGLEYEYEQEVPLGDSAQANLRFGALFLDETTFDTERRGYEAAQKRLDREVLWVRGEGSLELDAEHLMDAGKLDANAKLGFQMTRPFSYSGADPEAVMGVFVDNI